jgi:hypothetical protein
MKLKSQIGPNDLGQSPHGLETRKYTLPEAIQIMGLEGRLGVRQFQRRIRASFEAFQSPVPDRGLLTLKQIRDLETNLEELRRRGLIARRKEAEERTKTRQKT